MDYSEEQLKAAARAAVEAGDIDGARRLIDAARAAGSSRAPIRAAAQGLTVGASDEAIAAITNPISATASWLGFEETGKDYTDRLAAERKKLADYARDYPVESSIAELGGAAIPLAVSAVAGRGKPAPSMTARAAPLLERIRAAAPSLMKAGALQGGLYGFFSGEGGPMGRVVSAGKGAAAGAVMAPLAGAVTHPILLGVTEVSDAARRLFGRRGGKAVEAEIQRLAEGTGLTTDEIVQRIASGEIMAENATLRMSVRAMMAQGGKGETAVREAFDIRPPKTRAEAMSEIQKYLATTSGDENVLRATQMTRQQALDEETAAFNRIFEGGGAPVPADVRLALADTFERVPSAAKELAAYTRASTKTDPFFVVRDDGAVIFTRDPTTQEAEITRRFLQGKADEAYRGGSPWGAVFKDIERGVRAPLDVAVPQLAATRAEWANIKSTQDAFETGQKIFNMSADEVEILVDRLLREGDAGAAKFEALRNGAMDALRAKARGASGTSLMATLTNPERKESAILRALLPPDVYDDVAQKMGVAAQSQAARTDIIKGPTTALVTAAERRVGSEINAGEVSSALRGNFGSLLNVGAKLVKRAAPQLSDKERVQVLNVLLSEDPEVVRRALTDESALAALTDRINSLAVGLRGGAIGAATTGAADRFIEGTEGMR